MIVCCKPFYAQRTFWSQTRRGTIMMTSDYWFIDDLINSLVYVACFTRFLSITNSSFIYERHLRTTLNKYIPTNVKQTFRRRKWRHHKISTICIKQRHTGVLCLIAQWWISFLDGQNWLIKIFIWHGVVFFSEIALKFRMWRRLMCSLN